jgi:adenine-specific DNA-methyltransferase
MKYTLNGTSGGLESQAGTSGILKYVRLESYEDALNNIELKRSDKQTVLLEGDGAMREQYILSYMLNVESRGSQSLLNVQDFSNPDNYTLRVERNGETQTVPVDLVETFNWLLGLRVKTIDSIKGVRVVTGLSPQGEKVLVLWRNVKDMPSPKLDEFFQKQGYNTKDMEFDVIYVNGDNNLENLKKDEDTWKVRLIEEDFKRLMFDVQDV